MTVYQSIRAIVADRRRRRQVPVHALDIEVSRMTGLGLREVEAEAARLETEGLIRIGRGLNYNYYKFTMKMFEKAIKTFLDDKAEKDPAFAEKYNSEKKNIADCCKFIIAEVKKSCKGKEAACTDEYVYGLAMHYYDEENIKVPDNAPSCRVVVPGDVKLTEEDIKEAKAEAIRKLKEQEVQEQMRKERQRQEAAEKKAEAKDPACCSTLTGRTRHETEKRS